ncbi:putative ATP dependent RNA helicase [Myxozyma melibiosi]|uniref:RNA helicase n=1 Tax=Myxozyma melibiosi TaxID=54550 RepID=A0ABR1F346_9ASCO
MGVKRKHQSTESSKVDAKKRGVSTSSKPPSNESKTSQSSDDEEEYLDASNLHWKPVTLPDRVGDMEGLMGFEEIDGVAIEYENTVGGKEKIVKFKKVKPQAVKSAAEASTTAEGDEEKIEKVPELSKEELERKLARKKMHKERDQRKKERKKAAAKAASAAAAETNTFEALGELEDTEMPAWQEVYPLSESLLHGLKDLGFSAPTEIQRQALPLILEGHDVVGKAATGSGKTLAFGLAILEKYLSSSAASTDKKELTFKTAPAPAALILAPTRELVQQISEHITKASKYTTANIMMVTGGLAIQKQKRHLSYFPDVVVATPGRLHELMTSDSEGLIGWLAGVETLVLDEADRLLQDGHFKELNEILDMIGQNRGKDGAEESETESEEEEDDNQTDKKSSNQKKKRAKNYRQTLVFSATFAKDLTRKLSGPKKASNGKKKRTKFVSNTIEGEENTMAYLLDKLNFREGTPTYVDVNPDEAVKSEIIEGVMMCDAMQKDVFLYFFLLKYPGRTIVFVNSIDAVKRIARFLQELQVPAVAFHSHMIQKQRLRTIERFKENSHGILISTDVAARGLDIPHVKHVLHYHLPRSADMYVHRSGRTARGTDSGVAMILCATNEFAQLKNMAVKLGKKVKDFKTFEVEPFVVKQLAERVHIATDITKLETQLATGGNQLGKGHKNGKNGGSGSGADMSLLRQGAEDLGLDMSEAEDILASSDDDDEDDYKGHKGKKNGDADSQAEGTNKQRERQRAELQSLRQQLKGLVATPVMTGLMRSRSYITSGVVNIAQQMVDGSAHKTFLGQTNTTALEDVAKSKRQRKKHVIKEV